MSYSHYLPNEDGHTYRYNAISRRPVSPGFTERTSKLLNKDYDFMSFRPEETTPYFLSKKFASSKETTPFQTADYIPTKTDYTPAKTTNYIPTRTPDYYSSRTYDTSPVNHRRSGHFYMTSNHQNYDRYDDYDDYQRDNKV